MPVWCQWQISHANHEFDLHADMTRIPVNDPALFEYEYVSSCLHWYYVQFYSVPRLIFKAISIKKKLLMVRLKKITSVTLDTSAISRKMAFWFQLKTYFIPYRLKS